MPSLADLWDEDKYSEGDPVRQLIAFSKSIPDWPKDVLNFGNESIDSLTSLIPNKGLHTNLRGKLYDPMYNGETSVSATPGEDVQNAKHLAKAMNPLLWAGGQELNTFGLRKKITEALHNKYNMEINPSRRGFLVGKATADVVHPLEAPLDEILQTPMTRRTVNKGLAAGAAGVAMGGGLLSKFAKVPEAAKALETVAPIAEQATKYKYNTLAEYLDDAKKGVGDSQYWLNEGEHNDQFFNELLQKRLKQDEAAYKTAKQGGFTSSYHPDDARNIPLRAEAKKRLNEFSPQAKEEMKALKSMYGDDWVHQTQSSEFRHYLDNSGIINGPSINRGDSVQMGREHYWNGTKGNTEYPHLNPTRPGYNFWDESGGHGLDRGVDSLDELKEHMTNYFKYL